MVPTPTSADKRASSSSSQTVSSSVDRERSDRRAPVRRSRVLPMRSPIRVGASTVAVVSGPVGASGEVRSGSAGAGSSSRRLRRAMNRGMSASAMQATTTTTIRISMAA